MVAPIRDLGNITSNTSTFCASTLNMASNNDVIMDANPFDTFFENISDNFDEVRGHSLVLSTYSPRTPLMSSSNCEEDYATRIEKQNDRMDKDKPIVPSNSVQLKYMTPKSQNGQVSKVANITNIAYQQHVSNEDPAFN